MTQLAQASQQRIEAAGRDDRRAVRQARQDQSARLWIGGDDVEQQAVSDLDQREILVQDGGVGDIGLDTQMGSNAQIRMMRACNKREIIGGCRAWLPK
jgi:hypothetical protein